MTDAAAGASFATADLIDAFGDELESCTVQFRSFGRWARFCGPVSTVRCLEDNKLVRQQVEQPGEGRVLVVDGGGSLRSALVGDILAELARSNGWSGIVVFGAIRDSAVIADMEFEVKAVGTNPRKSSKLGTGAVDVGVSFGEASFEPGDWLYSDADGIVVAQRELPLAE